jgi:hypothetical protein
VVLPTMDFLFPPEGGVRSSLIVCSKWSQAENISTDVHKAVSCHNAGCIGIQSFDNKLLIPNAEKMIALGRLHKKRRV